MTAVDPYRTVRNLLNTLGLVRNSYLTIVLTFGLFEVCAAESFSGTDCAMSPSDREAVLKLSFTDFDQTEGKGWRLLYVSKCYAAAASLIVEYIDRYPERASEHNMLPFHAGQMLAMSGNYRESVRYLKLGYTQRESKIVDWNAFVDAHVAFIEKDAEKLEAMRARIAMQPAMKSGPGVPDWAIGKRINLDVVDGFLACFDKPFHVAYEAPCRPSE